ncbi:MAG: hypothetical protein IJ527_08290 [Prevotella sp.]|nr:hypothetical protein [Prevotella sp.]
MNVTERNFLRLLRAGVFTSDEALEPLSPFKWQKLYQMAVLLNVANHVGRGVEKCSQEYFVSLMPTSLKEKWTKAATTPPKEINEDTEEEHMPSLTNPLLNHRLEAIMDAESDANETPTRLLLLNIVRNTRYILNEGIALPQIVELAQTVKMRTNSIDYEKLNGWLKELRLQPMADLLGTLLTLLFGLSQQEIPFMRKSLSTPAEQLMMEMFNQPGELTEEWYFTQSSDQIFARTTNSRAMFWHVGHSARFSRLYPSEALTNFFKNFAHSLSHIEE